MRLPARVVFCVITIAIGATAPAVARNAPPCPNLVKNGDFEHVHVPGGFVHLDSIEGWTLEAGASIEVQRSVGNGAGGSNQYLEVASSEPTTVTQVLPTVSDQIYELRFQWSPRPGVADNALAVRWGEQVVARLNASGVGSRTPVWKEHAVRVIAYGSSTVLAFVDRSDAEDGDSSVGGVDPTIDKRPINLSDGVVGTPSGPFLPHDKVPVGNATFGSVSAASGAFIDNVRLCTTSCGGGFASRR